MEVKLIRTSKRPKPVMGISDDGTTTVGDEYLYTNNGRSDGWYIAMKVVYRPDENPDKEIVINIEKRDMR